MEEVNDLYELMVDTPHGIFKKSNIHFYELPKELNRFNIYNHTKLLDLKSEKVVYFSSNSGEVLVEIMRNRYYEQQ